MFRNLPPDSLATLAAGISQGFLESLLRLAGIGQIALVAASVFIPRLLDWKTQRAAMRPLTRQIFTTYSVYIAGTNLAFGLLSFLAPHWLLDGSGLAGAVSGFVALYWTGRIAVQFFYYDRRDAPSGPPYRAAEVALVGLFLFLATTYVLVFAHNREIL